MLKSIQMLKSCDTLVLIRFKSKNDRSLETDRLFFVRRNTDGS